jgi:putative PEP-CTERM system TPR-repeat lipoprotein
MASLEIAANNLEEARKHVDEVRKAAPSNALANYTQALIEVREDKYPAARDAILQALRAAPNHLPSLLAAGVIESALGAHDQAQAYLRRVLERAPRHLHARLLLVSSLMKGGQVPAAVEALQPALSQAPADPNVLALAGAVSMRNNEFAKAAQYFDKAAKLDPKNVETRAQLGISRLAAGEADHGLAELESAVKLNPDKPQADIVLVISHLQRKNYDQALKAVQGLEKKEPTNPLTYNLKAAIYMGKKDTANARKQLEHALELQPDFMPAVMNLAQLDLEDKNPISARARFEKVLEKDPKNPHALLGLAVAAPHLGATPAEQIAWLERARDASPTAIQPKLMLARAYAQTGDMKNALEIAQQTATANPDNVDAVDMLGVLQMNAGQKEQAVTTYSRLAALHPKSPVVLYRLAGAQGAGNDQAAAAATLKKALALKPDYGAAQVALVELYTRTQKYPEALALAKQIQKQETKSPAGHVLEGDVLMEQKKFAEAAKAYDSAYALGRTTEVAVKSHLAYVQSGKADEGDARLARWLKESPDDAIARQLAGDSALSRGKIKDAIGHYELIVQKQPDNAAVLNNLAVAYQQVKDPRALATGERAYKLKPDSAAVMDTLGWMLVEQGNLARGVELLRSAVTAAPNAAEVRYHLAQGLLKSGDKANARTELERIASSKASFPQHAEALALLKELQGKP